MPVFNDCLDDRGVKIGVAYSPPPSHAAHWLYAGILFTARKIISLAKILLQDKLPLPPPSCGYRRLSFAENKSSALDVYRRRCRTGRHVASVTRPSISSTRPYLYELREFLTSKLESESMMSMNCARSTAL